MNHQTYPCFWFNDNAQEAATFYCSVFSNSKITQSNSMVVAFDLEGQPFMALNGGNKYTPNASISFSVNCETTEEIDKLWNALITDGQVMMPLNQYEWSKKYGWLQDKYGISWQLNLKESKSNNQKIISSFMFGNIHQGKAQEAINFYTSLFDDSEIVAIHNYPKETPNVGGQIMYSEFLLDNKTYIAMDSGVSQSFTFTPGISHVIPCKSQEEIDYYWVNLTEGGREDMCGWCQDKFGVSWQIIPAILPKLMSNPEKAPKVARAFMKMKKFDIEVLIKASE